MARGPCRGVGCRTAVPSQVSSPGRRASGRRIRPGSPPPGRQRWWRTPKADPLVTLAPSELARSRRNPKARSPSASAPTPPCPRSTCARRRHTPAPGIACRPPASAATTATTEPRSGDAEPLRAAWAEPAPVRPSLHRPMRVASLRVAPPHALAPRLRGRPAARPDAAERRACTAAASGGASRQICRAPETSMAGLTAGLTMDLATMRPVGIRTTIGLCHVPSCRRTACHRCSGTRLRTLPLPPAGSPRR